MWKEISISLAWLIFACQKNTDFWEIAYTRVQLATFLRQRKRDVSSLKRWQVIYSPAKSRRVRISAHVLPTGSFPNCLVSRLTVCLRDERRVAWNFRTHDYHWRNTFTKCNGADALKNDRSRTGILFIARWTLTTTSRLNDAANPSRENVENLRRKRAGYVGISWRVFTEMSRIISSEYISSLLCIF